MCNQSFQRADPPRATDHAQMPSKRHQARAVGTFIAKPLERADCVVGPLSRRITRGQPEFHIIGVQSIGHNHQGLHPRCGFHRIPARHIVGIVVPGVDEPRFGLRCHVDHPPTSPAPDHQPRRMFGCQDRRTQADTRHRVQMIDPHVDQGSEPIANSCSVYQNIEPTIDPLRVSDEICNFALITQIARHHGHFSPGGLQAIGGGVQIAFLTDTVRRKGFTRCRTAIMQQDLGPLCGRTHGDGLAQTLFFPSGPGDQRNLSGKRRQAVISRVVRNNGLAANF